MTAQVTVSLLRKKHPAWNWSAERHGFGGWRYRGECQGANVSVEAFGLIYGDEDDDTATQWRVDDGKVSVPFYIWSSREAKAGNQYEEE